MNLLLAPHFDDESLFAAYICLREKPLVLFCFDGAPRHGSFDTRWHEAQQAVAVLGCEALTLSESYETLGDRLLQFDPDHVWAPLPEQDGNGDHNFVGAIAEFLWPGRVTFYTTYTPAGRTVTGSLVLPEPDWPVVKRQALDCYQSQRLNRSTRAHFERSLDEYEVVMASA